MRWVVLDSKEAVGIAAADQISRLLQEKPTCVLGLATGGTPLGTYRELIRRHQTGELEMSRVTTFNLDEYYGLDRDHPQSYWQYMQEHLFRSLPIPEERIHMPPGKPEQVEASCLEYEQEIEQAGGIDLQLLGIGANGHIGFNEPAESLQPATHLAKLAESTVQANARFFASPEEVPQYAITMGIGTIMKAKRIVLLATGEAKAEILSKLYTSPITTRLPASMLHMHPHVTILADREAGSLLPFVQEGIPTDTLS
ncbi:glucosamine-6-phosphate deaminase [Xylanibacillus composti]|uniref:Glucosamine-6-phosphate deaminase n=1 Tax=Xylanibacillus composti TaxID=1572762 RepID=A0A8J4M3B6_9BACL|nr:glucosamine-6-phosphate deaminase [Xylanibacillus composti]MDT9726494.1 glucosamine-6-phosphate deaminase [Xylanibacillus composti]GIQ69935.1 glucosamine-6-phosphate deaminase [Xylanibacillus composti]